MVKDVIVTSRSRDEFIDVTHELADAVREAGIEEGVVTAFVRHTTAALTINENADPAVQRDLLTSLRRLIPEQGDYRHAEGNSDAHLKSSCFGASEQVIVSGGRLLLGTWQGVYFCEFDGPRTRHLLIHVQGS